MDTEQINDWLHRGTSAEGNKEIRKEEIRNLKIREIMNIQYYIIYENGK